MKDLDPVLTYLVTGMILTILYIITSFETVVIIGISIIIGNLILKDTNKRI